MSSPNVRRVTRELTDSERIRIQKLRQHIDAELPELQMRDQMRKDAREEQTLSGEIRSAIHQRQRPLAELAENVGVSAQLLDEFLTGERTLRSDVLDRLARALEFHLRFDPSTD